MGGSLHLRIERALRAGSRGLWLRTCEEARAIDLAEGIGEALGWPVHTWSPTRGRDHQGARLPLAELLGELAEQRGDALWILLDPGAALAADPIAQRALRELAQRSRGPAILAIGPGDPPTRIPELVGVELGLPDPEELRRRLDRLGRSQALRGVAGADAALDAAGDGLARLGLGLDLLTFDRLIAEALLAHGADPAALLRHVGEHKPDALAGGGLLERAAATPPELLGGLEGLKRWLRRRALALDPRARAAAIPDPRGVLLVGVQGCGKSLAARVCASMLGLELLRLEPGRLFGGTVGESEANLRQVTALAERLAPVVLWIDEIDKGFAGADAGASDGGTTARVVGGLLTWLQERRRPVFVVATANQIDRLPPELLRRGRLDEVFFVDLPDAETRRAIARVHLELAPAQRLGAAPPLADPLGALLEVAAAAEGFSGAELEAAIVEARLDAFAEGRPLAAADLERAVQATVPLSRARRGSIEALRSWAREGARPA
ncbi:MAG: AAA family ATPase [Myxococcales bacterium]|nr:AAA family ATPase [Myxococcales bacterium]